MADLPTPQVTYPRISPIRDVIHNYIKFSVFERDVIDSKYFQRLHFVLQNSAAYSAYPCNKNSRFAHSLGVSHLCGRLFIHSLKNAHEDNLVEFLELANKFLLSAIENVNDHSTAQGEMISSWKKTLGNAARFLHNPPVGTPRDTGLLNLKLPVEFIVNTIWVSLRICGLAHDIGHLPMSHSFEDAIKDVNNVCAVLEADAAVVGRIQSHKKANYVECFDEGRETDSAIKRLSILVDMKTSDIQAGLEALALHERRSFKILDKIKRNPINKYDLADVRYRDLVFLIAEVILLSTKRNAVILGNNSLLTSLRDIVAGGLDADRLDYTLRDPKSSGLELGVYDADRIVTNTTLCKSGDRLQIAFADSCISAIESFFHQRYLVYSALVYHRTAVRTKAILRELLARLIVFAYQHPSDHVAHILNRNHVLALEQVRGTQFEVGRLLPSEDVNLIGFDDSRLRTMLFDVLAELEAPSPKQSSKPGNEINMLVVLIKTFLFRIRENWFSPGKSVASSRALLDDLEIRDVNPFVLGDGGIRNSFQKLIVAKRCEIQKQFDGKLCMIVSQLPPKVYNKSDDDSGKVFVTARGNREAIPAEEMSSFMLYQHEILRRDMDYSISFVAKDLRSTLMKEAMSIFNDILTAIADIKRKAPALM